MCRGDSFVKESECSKCTCLGGNNRGAKTYLWGFTYFKSHIELLSIARVYLRSWRQKWLYEYCIAPVAATLSKRVSMLRHAWMDKVDFFIMRTLPFTSLLSFFTYRRGMQREADWSWKTQRQHYYLRKNEPEKSFLKTVNIRKWCMIFSASQSPSLKWGSSVQQGNRSRRQSVYSDFVSFSC